ncbi:MAG: SDR family NAD(P)-dependent oxidoreductase [Pseudonocardiaceae bacterium]
MRPAPEQTVPVTGATDGLGKALATELARAGATAVVHGRDNNRGKADGIELRFAVNYLAGYLLTHLLLPTLRSSAPARILQVSSAGQSPIDFDDVMLTRSYSGGQAYCQSKLAQIMFTFDLADELTGTGVTATALHPPHGLTSGRP